MAGLWREKQTLRDATAFLSKYHWNWAEPLKHQVVDFKQKP
jgi:hypothetical protein